MKTLQWLLILSTVAFTQVALAAVGDVGGKTPDQIGRMEIIAMFDLEAELQALLAHNEKLMFEHAATVKKEILTMEDNWVDVEKSVAKFNAAAKQEAALVKQAIIAMADLETGL